METSLWIQEEYIMESFVVGFFMFLFIPVAIMELVENIKNNKMVQQECIRAKSLIEIENMRRKKRIIQNNDMKKGA